MSWCLKIGWNCFTETPSDGIGLKKLDGAEEQVLEHFLVKVLSCIRSNPLKWAISLNQPDRGHLAKYVVEVGDEDDNEGEAAKDVEEAGHISGTGGAHQIPGGNGRSR